jgi:putative alpha-1,2-mannosidase
LAQYWTRKVVETAFSGLSPASGFNGDEDQGLMGSLSVLMKIGLFQMNGGTEEDPEYQLGSPIFDKITIQLAEGKELVINAPGASSGKQFTHGLKLNGTPTQNKSLNHFDLVNGGILDFDMGDMPNTEWGSSKETRPYLLDNLNR